MSVVKEFREFLVKDNALALAIGVIIGGAMGRFVGSITNDILMPIIGIFMPAETSWDTWGFDLVREGNTMKVGALISAIINLVIIGLVCFMLVKAFVPKKKDA